MNIGHHRKGKVGQAHHRDVNSDHNDDDDGCNNIEERTDVDELEMGNGGRGITTVRTNRLAITTTKKPRGAHSTSGQY